MTSSPRILSVNLGKGVMRPYASGPDTAIDKRPVPIIEVRDPGPRHGGLGSGVIGDDIGDRKHHGGANQAVYAYAREDLDWWAAALGRELPHGQFGENVTTVGIDCTHARIGELWRIGEVTLQVQGPRIPCATFAGHMGERRWVKRFTAEGMTGAYLSVMHPGSLQAGDPVTIERPDHDIDTLLVFRAFTGDLVAARRVVDAHVLNPKDHADLEETLRVRTG